MGTLATKTWKSGSPPLPPRDDFGDGGSGGRGASRRASFTGLFVLLAGVTMFFAAFTSAYIVRKGLSNDWVKTPLPAVLWVNTVVLIASSAALEVGRRRLRAGERERFNFFWTAGTALGLLFLAGQYLAWTQLSAQGIYISTNPSSSFFYLFTAAHGVHLLGGVIAMLYVNFKALRLELGPGKRTAVDITTAYWHFLDGLWIYLLM